MRVRIGVSCAVFFDAVEADKTKRQVLILSWVEPRMSWQAKRDLIALKESHHSSAYPTGLRTFKGIAMAGRKRLENRPSSRSILSASVAATGRAPTGARAD